MTTQKAPLLSRIIHHPALKVAVIVLLFITIALAYFYPAAFEGRRLFQMDGAGAAGVAQDVRALKESTGHKSFWTGSLFGGMPMYQISPSYPSGSLLHSLKGVYQLNSPIPLLPGDSYLVFMLLLGGYIFMRAWGWKRLLSIAGAIMWTFSSYFLILIDAGHIWKLEALCYIPPTIAGLVLAFRQHKYWAGFVVTGLFTALQILANHIQMSYYFAFLMFALVVGWAVEAAQKHTWKQFGKALAVVIAGAAVGILINSSNLYHTYKYAQQTMRGGSEITQQDKGGPKQALPKGLDKAYITQWSYGISEMLTYIIPDAKGGATGYIGHDTPGIEKLSAEGQQFVAQQNRYWGNQPFTAGPVYVGIFVMCLALFGCFVAKGPIRWAVIGVTLLSILLAWGHNFMWLTSLFIDYFPLYNKFRTVSSILVISELTIPFMAIWALGLIVKNPNILKTRFRAALIALALTGGVALVLAIFPGLGGSYLSRMEADAFAPYMAQNPQIATLIDNLKSVREAILAADAWRSIIFTLVGVVILLAFYKQKLSENWCITLIALLCLVDLWGVDKRYLNDAKYLPAQEVAKRAYVTTAADKEILQDTTQFRVMNLTVDTFNDATTSYHHRSVGGYHAAKLQRYQDVIEGYLSKQNRNVLRALNTKYYIVADSLRNPIAVKDEGVYGDAWFVSGIKSVNNAQEEFQAIGTTPLNHVAIIAPPYNAQLTQGAIQADSTAFIKLTSYVPDKICYHTRNSKAGLAVFSEIFYPDGWKAYIDGREVPILRVNYILRGLEIPQGDHSVIFEFNPTSLHVTEKIGYAATVTLLLGALGWTGNYYIRRRKRPNSPKA